MIIKPTMADPFATAYFTENRTQMMGPQLRVRSKHESAKALPNALRGRTALAFRDPASPKCLLVQFDLPSREAERHPEEHPECFGWHPYPTADFIILTTEEK